jgi:S1-C subfamily serine protease/uncharacterized protein YecT (DUF1311 family)
MGPKWLTAILGVFVVSFQTAWAFECTGVTLASNVVICSDPELMRIADERQQAFNEARSRVGENRFPELWAGQRAWVRNYATRCGVPPGLPPPLPVPPEVKDCMRRAGEERTAYLRSYGLNLASPPSPVLPNAMALDCSHANTRAEKAICSNFELRGADDAMARAYLSLRETLPPDQQPGLLRDQREWVKTRDRDCDYVTSVNEYSKCLLSQTIYRKNFLSREIVSTPNGARISPNLFHEDRQGIYQITVLYPNAEGGTPESTSKFNNLVHYISLQSQNLKDLHAANTLSVANTHFGSYKLNLLNANLISVVFTSNTYAGGAHGSSDRYAILFDLTRGEKFELGSLLNDTTRAIPAISQICEDKLRREASKGGWANMLWFDDPSMRADPGKEIKDIRNWLFHTGDVEILFGHYTIGPYVIGMHECLLTYTELSPWINLNGPLAEFARIVAKPVPKPPAAELPKSIVPVPEQTATPVIPKLESKPASSGTAFAINSEGNFLTNYHVVKGCSALELVASGIHVAASVIANDERNDLAVLRAPKMAVPPVHFREGKGIRPADEVVALGFPYAGLLASSPQVTAGAVSALAGLFDDSRYLQFTAPVQPGNSGGPLLDRSGNLVGIVAARINDIAVAKVTGSLPQNINFAIKTAIVREFLDANQIPYLTAPSDTKLDPADVGEAATKFTVLVKCSQ